MPICSGQRHHTSTTHYETPSSVCFPRLVPLFAHNPTPLRHHCQQHETIEQNFTRTSAPKSHKYNRTVNTYNNLQQKRPSNATPLPAIQPSHADKHASEHAFHRPRHPSGPAKHLVLERRSGGEPLPGVHLQHPFQQPGHLLALLPAIPADELADHLGAALLAHAPHEPRAVMHAAPRQPPRDQHERHHAGAPHVRARAAPARRAVRQRAPARGRAARGEPEVRQHDLRRAGVPAQEEVVGLDVVVRDAVLVQVRERLQHGLDERERVRERQRLLQRGEVGQQRHDEVQRLPVDEGVVQLDDVVVARQEVEDVALGAPERVAQRDALDGEARMRVRGSGVHRAEGAARERGEQRVSRGRENELVQVGDEGAEGRERSRRREEEGLGIVHERDLVLAQPAREMQRTERERGGGERDVLREGWEELRGYWLGGCREGLVTEIERRRVDFHDGLCGCSNCVGEVMGA